MDNLRSHNKPVDITLQIYNIIKNKSEYDDAKKELEKFLNNIAYWSPELIELRYWKYIYKICINFFNKDNDECRKIFNIYTENIIRYKHYNSFYEWTQSQINMQKAIESNAASAIESLIHWFLLVISNKIEALIHSSKPIACMEICLLHIF